MFWFAIYAYILYKLIYPALYGCYYYLERNAREPTNSIWSRLLRSFETHLSKSYVQKQPTIPLLEVDSEDINPELFNYLTHGKTRPLVIRGLLNNSEAVKQWCPKYFKENYGDTKILSVEDQKCSDLNICEIIKMLRSGEKPLYANNVTPILGEYPNLINELGLDNIEKIDNSINSRNWLKLNMSMSGKGTDSSLHCAVAGNFFFNIYGKKKWILIDPKYTPALQSDPSKNFTFAMSGLDIKSTQGTKLENIPKHEITLNPGDVLYNPPWWWNSVKNVSDFTIACEVYDHTTYTASWWNNPTFMILTPYSWNSHPWVLKAIQLWKGREYIIENLKEN